MFKTVFTVCILIAAILWLPLWVQIVAFGIAVSIVSYRPLLLIPAVLSDVLYAPTDTISLAHLKMTFLVLALILIQWIIATKLRTTHTYGLETK